RAGWPHSSEPLKQSRTKRRKANTKSSKRQDVACRVACRMGERQSPLLRIPRKWAQFFRMSSDVSDDSVPLLRSAHVAVRVGWTQDLWFELVHPIENGHPPFLDRFNAQPEICAEFGIGLSNESRAKKSLLCGAQTQHRGLVTIECRGNRVRRGGNTFGRGHCQCTFRFGEFRDYSVRSRRPS